MVKYIEYIISTTRIQAKKLSWTSKPGKKIILNTIGSFVKFPLGSMSRTDSQIREFCYCRGYILLRGSFLSFEQPVMKRITPLYLDSSASILHHSLKYCKSYLTDFINTSTMASFLTSPCLDRIQHRD
jgi:hypothetical protein